MWGHLLSSDLCSGLFDSHIRWFDVSSSPADETVTLSAVLERLNPHLAQIKVLHKVFCTGVAEVPPETPNVVRASHLLNTLYKAILEYDSVGEASEQAVSSVWIKHRRLDVYRLHSSSYCGAVEHMEQKQAV